LRKGRGRWLFERERRQALRSPFPDARSSNDQRHPAEVRDADRATNAYVPNDERSARVYFQTEDRLPKEITFEEYLQLLAKDINFEKIANPKTIYDLVVTNFAATKIEKVGPANTPFEREFRQT